MKKRNQIVIIAIVFILAITAILHANTEFLDDLSYFPSDEIGTNHYMYFSTLKFPFNINIARNAEVAETGYGFYCRVYFIVNWEYFEHSIWFRDMDYNYSRISVDDCIRGLK